MKVFNLNGDEWDRQEDREGWRSKDAWVGHHIGAELLGGSMYELEAGDKLWTYHTNHANEEWVVVLRGTPTLRTHDAEEVLKEGDVVCFPRGKEGAHQIINRTDEPIRVLMLSTLVAPDIVEYLDTGKVGARSVAGERIMLSKPGPERLALILNLVVAVPLFEEVVFRVLLKQGVKAQLALVVPLRSARLLSVGLASVSFTALHEPPTFFPVFVLSLLLGAAYEKSGRLLVPIALHAAHNLAVIVYDSLALNSGATP